ncbi:MAG: 30S ribosomal protein S6 [Ignavibacteriae bacterium]|nr:30S ribosomal protein S6 [Ignavibacteriota bacterium]
MSTKHYESVVIINSSLEDEQVQQTISNIKESITTNGGEITAIDDWGRKRLAYNINKSKTGYYLISRFTALPAMVVNFERALKLDETIVRYMTIALDKKALENIEKMKNMKVEEEAKSTEEPNEKKEEAKTSSTSDE